MNEKVEYILEQLEGKPKEEITLTLDEDVLETIISAANTMGVTVSEFIELSLIEKLIDIEVEKHEDTFPNIIDISDFYRIDEIIEEEKLYLVINPTGEHVVLMPVQKYDFMVGIINDSLS